MDATNAAYGEFEHSCGHLLDIGRQQQQEPSETVAFEHQARRRLTGKQKAPAGMHFDPPQTAVRPGPETINSEDADGHVLMVYKGWNLIWCSVCGRYQTDRRTCRLRERCPRQPANRSHFRLKRLQSGRHPTTGEPLGETAQRLTLAGWPPDAAISACAKGGEELEESLTPGTTQSRGAERASTVG